MSQGRHGGEPPRRRVGVNPEALRGLGRALLQDPRVRAFAGVVELIAPDVADAVRELDEHLPEVVGAVEDEARFQIRREAKRVTGKATRAIRGLVDEALVARGKREPKVRRLRAAAPARTAKAKK